MNIEEVREQYRRRVAPAAWGEQVDLHRDISEAEIEVLRQVMYEDEDPTRSLRGITIGLALGAMTWAAIIFAVAAGLELWG